MEIPLTQPNDPQQPNLDHSDRASAVPTMLSSSDAEESHTNDGASTSLRPPYGRSQAQAPAQGGGGAPARAPELGVVAAEGSRDQDQPHTTTPPAAAAAAAAVAPRAVRASAAAAARRKPKRRTRDAVRQKKSRVTVRFDSDEKRLLEEQAATAGLSLAHFIARRVLAATGAPVAGGGVEQLDEAIDELAAARSALAPWGNNLNQIAKHLNAEGVLLLGLADEFAAVAPRLLAQVRADVARIDESVFRLARRRGRG